MQMDSLGKRIKHARKLGKLTQQQVASIFKIDRVNVSQWESDTTKPEIERLPALADLLGVTTGWLLDATGSGPLPGFVPKFVGSFDPDTQETDRDPDWDGRGAGMVNGRITFAPQFPGGMPEIAASTGAGLGKIDDDRAVRIVAKGIASGHPVVNEWVIPRSYVRNGLGARPSEVIILPVVGHSMEPMLRANDRVLVDTSQNVWMGDAVYVIDDGDTILRVKTIKKITSSSPPRFKIVSEASPDDPELLDHDQFHIVGRVVGRFTQM